MSNEEIDTIPLFEMRASASDPAGDHQKGARSVAQGICPGCAPSRKMGLLRTTSHLVWREHTHPSWAGTPITCRASLVALCVLPDRAATVRCDCQS